MSLPVQTMASSALDDVRDAIKNARFRTRPLVLLLGLASVDTVDPAEAIRDHFGWPTVNVGRSLSQRLLDVPRHRRPFETESILRELVAQATGPVVYLERLELLFLADLKVDVVQLLIRLAADRVVVARWPGRWTGTSLSYAEPGHPEHQTWPRADIEVVDILKPWTSTP